MIFLLEKLIFSAVLFPSLHYSSLPGGLKYLNLESSVSVTCVIFANHLTHRLLQLLANNETGLFSNHLLICFFLFHFAFWLIVIFNPKGERGFPGSPGFPGLQGPPVSTSFPD